MALGFPELTLFVIIGTLAAIVYSLRVLVLLERRIAKMDQNIERVTKKVLSEEIKIENMEKKLLGKKTSSKTNKKRTKRRK